MPGNQNISFFQGEILGLKYQMPSEDLPRGRTGIWSIPVALMLSRLSKIFVITFPDTFDSSKSLNTLHEVLA